MDGNFISTDIHYRDKVKSRRRSTSCANNVMSSSGGARSKSVGARSGGGGEIGSPAVGELGGGGAPALG